jgi:vanillate O-demethylase monooxygenase subunit
VKWLLNAWYQAAWSSDLGKGAGLRRTICDEPIYVFRGVSGGVSALRDRCPHRFAPLSAGQIVGDAVACGYHGLSFDGAGACVANPHGPIVERMRVRSYPVVELHEAIWVWLGDGDKADPSSIPDLSFIDDAEPAARISLYMPVRAHYQLLVDNIMDLSHADYLHPSSLGGMVTQAKATSREEKGAVIAEWIALDCPPPPAFRSRVPPGSNADIWLQVIWRPPGVMVLGTAANAPGAPRQWQDEGYTLHNVTPETSERSHYFVCSTRRYRQDDPAFVEMLRKTLLHAFDTEDKPMIELQQAEIGPHDLLELDPILLRVDAAAVRARRYLRKLIDEDVVSARAVR